MRIENMLSTLNIFLNHYSVQEQESVLNKHLFDLGNTSNDISLFFTSSARNKFNTGKGFVCGGRALTCHQPLWLVGLVFPQTTLQRSARMEKGGKKC